MKNWWEQAGSASTIFQSYIITEWLIIIAVKHTVCWLDQFCQEMGKCAPLQLPAAVSHIAMISQFSMQGYARWESGSGLAAAVPSSLSQPKVRHRQDDFPSCKRSESSLKEQHIVLRGRELSSTTNECMGFTRSVPVLPWMTWASTGEPFGLYDHNCNCFFTLPVFYLLIFWSLTKTFH